MLTTEWGPVGTRGGCGAGWGPCACPRWGAICLLHAIRNGSRCQQDKHKAPSSTPPRPLSLQDAGGHFLSFPYSVVTIHQVCHLRLRYPGYFVKVHNCALTRSVVVQIGRAS